MVAPRAASHAADPYNFDQCGRDGVRKDLQVFVSVSVSLLLVTEKILRDGLCHAIIQ